MFQFLCCENNPHAKGAKSAKDFLLCVLRGLGVKCVAQTFLSAGSRDIPVPCSIFWGERLESRRTRRQECLRYLIDEITPNFCPSIARNFHPSLSVKIFTAPESRV